MYMIYPYIVTQEICHLINPNLHTESPIVKSPTEVVCFRRELTCGYIFLPIDSADQIELVGDLSLHP